MKRILVKVYYFDNIDLFVKFQMLKFTSSKNRQSQIFGSKYLLFKDQILYLNVSSKFRKIHNIVPDRSKAIEV